MPTLNRHAILITKSNPSKRTKYSVAVAEYSSKYIQINENERSIAAARNENPQLTVFEGNNAL